MSNTLPQQSSFQRVSVHKDVLLAALLDNKKTHDEIFANAVEGYYVKIKDELKNRIESLSDVKGDFLKVINSIDPSSKKPVELKFEHAYKLFNINVPFPQDHSDDYNRAIRMVQFSHDQLFTLTQAEFAQYVMNEWSWKEDFIATNSLYVTGVAPTAAMRKFSNG